MKPFKGISSKKKETVGSLLIPIFMHLGIRLDEAKVNFSRLFMDEAHLTNSGWLKDSLLWIFREGVDKHLLQLLHHRL